MSDLDEFVAWLHHEIHERLNLDSHCKHYEGEVDLEVAGALDKPRVTLTLRMYLFAPIGREHKWTASTVAEAVSKAHADCAKWIAESNAE